MARRRSKVKLEYISSNGSRKNCFKKRSKSFVKKMDEVTTLCDVEGCALIYSDFDNVAPTIWPSVDGVRRVIGKFQDMPESQRERRGVNQEGFIRQMVVKAEEKLKKMKSENRYREFTKMLYEILEEPFPVVPFMVNEDYEEFDRVLSQHMREAWTLIQNRKKGSSAGSSSNPPPLPPNDDVLINNMMIPTPDLNFSPFNMDFSMPVVPSPHPFLTDFSPSNDLMINSPMPHLGSFPPDPSNADDSPMPDMGFFFPPS